MKPQQLSPTGKRHGYAFFQPTLKNVFRHLLLFVFLTGLFRCSDYEMEIEPVLPAESTVSTLTAAKTAALAADCSSCRYVVPPLTHRIDGQILGIKPGDKICLNAATNYTTPILFVNMTGTPAKPIIITNCGGTVNIKATGKSFVMKTEKSKYFRITGSGSGSGYGIRLSEASLGLTLDYLSTNFQVDHLEVYNVGFAGIMAKTDPTCDDATIRGNFTMRDVTFNDNYVHDSGGEGFYIGNSFYMNGMSRSCGVRFPHNIEGVKIHNNIIKNAGWEAIQLGSAPKNAKVYNNRIENFGTKNVANQRNGIQLGEGTGGECYNNFINTGNGNGLNVLGYGDNVVHDNIIVNPGLNGIFCDERVSPGPGFKFINNTIINPGQDGIRIYADLVPMNVIINNIIINPGSYGSYKHPRTGADAYVYKLNKNVKLQMSNNTFTRNINQLKFVNSTDHNYRLKQDSPARDKGKNIATYNIAKDFYNNQRLRGNTYDIGAHEF
jgi:hypothetical protein